MSTATRTAIEALEARAQTIPTDGPESDGTLEWDSTTIVVVHARAGGETGLGYTYTDAAATGLVEGKLADAVKGRDAVDVEGSWHAMSAALRNVGRPGLGFMALSAVDIALWDLKARLLGCSLLDVLDAPHDEVPIYGSGGFCSYSDERLREQLGGWAEQGIPRVKMKVGREPERDRHRCATALEAIGEGVELFVDANGAYSREEAIGWANVYGEDFGATWFEEPVTSDDLAGLARVREGAPDGLEVAAGEYGDLLPYFERMAPVVDCLQVDVTRCGGITGLLAAAEAAARHDRDVSAHCAPGISAVAFCAVPRLRHLEYFHDHVRVEAMLFDGLAERDGGVLRPDRSRPGHGLELR